ncbi:MAG: thermonuclease family protein [Nitrospirae bacterium]|nr:thermonuclease family protein [Nitrospirota bacterium]
MKHLYYTVILSIFILFASVVTSFGEVPGNVFHVTQVPDGVNLTIRVKSFAGIPLKVERVRLIGLNAADVGYGHWGRQAKKLLKKIIGENAWVVNVEYDTQQRDQQGRLLAYLWNRKGDLINEKLIEAGYAVLNIYPPNLKYADRLTAAQKRAQAAGAGIWKKTIGSKK